MRITDLPGYLPGKAPKYKATRVKGTAYGDFDSKGEYSHYLYLLEQQRLGVITDLERQVVYPIVINGTKVCTVKPDYRYKRNGEVIVADYKGIVLPMAKLKFKLVKAVYGVHIVIITKIGQGF